MSSSEPSAIVLHGILCIGGLYTSFDSKGEIGSLKVRLSSVPQRRSSCLRAFLFSGTLIPTADKHTSARQAHSSRRVISRLTCL